MFKIASIFQPTGDQPQAIEKLAEGVIHNLKNQVLLGVTGSGKTYTMAKVIEKLQMPALIISHNKTLAGQLYQEFRDFFPENAVSYFVSYYDYYQPEAYIPQTDTYIEKEAEINELIDKLRLETTNNILTRNDVIVVASVSCIYNIGSPQEYKKMQLQLQVDDFVNLKEFFSDLIRLQYQRSEFEFTRGSFRLRGDYVDIYSSYQDIGWRLYIENQKIKKIFLINPVSGEEEKPIDHLQIFPAKQYVTTPERFEEVEGIIREDLKKESMELKKKNKLVEAERLIRRVNYDLEMIKEVGYVNGIENYSRYFDGRSPGQRPYTLLDYFLYSYGKKFLVFIDESHITIPQLRGMYNGDKSRKEVLIEFGFRLKAALDNRPLKFDEFYSLVPYFIYVSATPDIWELNQSRFINQERQVGYETFKKIYQGKDKALVEQLIRPTGIPDPEVVIRPAKNEIKDLLSEIKEEVKKGNKVLVTALTKRTAEDLSSFLKEKEIKAEYLHSEIKTLERSELLDNLRKGNYDVLVGINLLREGLDLPEVSLVAILDADQEGFLRSTTSLIQIMGRASRNVNGRVIIYTDKITKSIREALKEINRRRKIQLEFNKKYNIKPRTIYKPIREKIIVAKELPYIFDKKEENFHSYLNKLNKESLTPYDRKRIIKRLEKEMKAQAEKMNFELAIEIRDKIRELKE